MLKHIVLLVLILGASGAESASTPGPQGEQLLQNAGNAAESMAEPASSLGWNEYNGGDANEWTTANLPGNDPHDEESWMDPMSTEFWIYTSVCLVLVCFSGLFSGLTVGLMSVSALQMSVLKANDLGDPKEKMYAERLEPVLRPDRHHLLLVTLLLANAACMEALPIFLNKLVPEWMAIILSVGFVLVFGEIIPQAACVDSPLKIGSALAPVVKFFMFILYPIAWPISKILDWILGHDGSHFLSGRSQLQSLLSVTQREKVLEANETRILKAVIGLKTKQVRDKQTLAQDIYMLSEDDVLDRKKLQEVLDRGHSRIPVYRGHRNNVRSILLAKSLIVVNPEDRLKVSQMPEAFMRPPIWVSPDTELLPLLDEFISGRLHLALVTDQLREVEEVLNAGKEFPSSVQVQGLITMEDVIEALIDEPILDEFDTPQQPAADEDRSVSTKTAVSRREPKTPRADTADGDHRRSRGKSMESEGKSISHRLVYPMRFKEQLADGPVDEFGYSSAAQRPDEAPTTTFQADENADLEPPSSVDLRRIKPSALASSESFDTSMPQVIGSNPGSPSNPPRGPGQGDSKRGAQERPARSVSAVDGTLYNRGRWLSHNSHVDHDYFSARAPEPKNFSGLLDSIFAQGRARSSKNVVRITGPPSTPRSQAALASTPAVGSGAPSFSSLLGSYSASASTPAESAGHGFTSLTVPATRLDSETPLLRDHAASNPHASGNGYTYLSDERV